MNTKSTYLLTYFCLILISCFDKGSYTQKNNVEWIVKLPNIERKYYLQIDSLLEQENYNYFKVDKYFVEEKVTGLPYNGVETECLFTKNNEIILGSYGKVASLDSNKWIIYDAINSGIPDKRINAVAKDKNGKLYIGYDGAGIVTIHNGENKHLTKQNSPIIDMDISSILPTKNRGIFFATDSGIMQLNKGRWKIYNNQNSIMPYIKDETAYVPSKISLGPDNKIYAQCGNKIAFLEKDKWEFVDLPPSLKEDQVPTFGCFVSKFALVYVDKSYSKLYLFKKGKWSELKLKHTSHLRHNSTKKIWDVIFVNENEFYIVYYHSVIKVNGNEQLLISPKKMGFHKGAYINCTSISNKNNLAIGSNFGFAIQEKDSLTNYTTLKSFIPSPRVYSIIQDSSNKMLSITYRGISENNQAKKIKLDFKNSDFGSGGLIIDCITKVFDNHFYIGSSNRLLLYKNDTLSKIEIDDIDLGYIKALQYSKKNDILYIGTNNGFFTYSNKEFEFIKESNLKSNNVNLIKIDDDNLVYVVYDKSISIYKNKKLIDNIIIKESEQRSFHINDIDITKNEILIGTSKGWYIKKENYNITKAKKHSKKVVSLGDKNIYNFNEVSSLIKSNSGKVYLGGNFATLYIYENQKYKSFNLKRLANVNKINNIQQLDDNNIYISTDNGLIIYTND